MSDPLLVALTAALDALADGADLPPAPPGADAVWRRLEALAARQRASDAELVALRANSRFLDSIVEHIPHMIFVKDAEELRFLRFNGAGERLLGYSRDDLLGRNDHDFFPPDEADFFIAKDREVLASGELHDIPEEPIHTSSGERWLHTKKIPLLDEQGRPLYLLGISEDITARKRASEELVRTQSELAAKEERLRLLLAHLPGVIWTADPSLVVTTCAGAGATHLGIDPDTVVGTPVSEHPVIAGEGGELVDAALRGERLTSEVRHAGHVYEVRVERLGRPTGPPGLIGIALDVTERRKLEAERLRSRLQRAQKLESLGLLAGGIAHDFNNLLASILGNASLALMKLPEDSSVRPLLQRVETTAERAADLTRQLLAYSGRGRFVIEPVALPAVVEDIGELLRVSTTKDAHLRFAFEGDLPPVDADVAQIRQLVMNLITNASDALEGRPGTITVSIGRVEADAAYLANSWLDENLEPGTYVTLEVCDSGCGMDAATQDQMFDPFFSTKQTGHGLGLAAALGIVRGHGGGIRVYSEPDSGTSIKVLLPASDATAEPAPAPTSADARSVGDGLVMVVDDEEQVRVFATGALQTAGFRVIAAADGIEAVDVYRRHRHEVAAVLLDMTMPRQGGRETFHALRRIDPDVRVLLSSGYNEEDATSRFAGRGLAGFLQKPYRASDLIARIRALVDA